MLYLFASNAACTPLPLPAAPNNTTRGVCGAAERVLLDKNVITGMIKELICLLI